MTTSPSKVAVGLDLSLNGTGVVVLRHGPSGWAPPEMHWLRRKKRIQSVADHVERFVGVTNEVEQLVKGADMVAIEDYAFAYGRTNTNCITKLGELGGAVRWRLFVDRIPFSLVPILVAKKWATGNGKAEKPQVAQAMAEMWGLTVADFPSDDCSDALSLASIAARLLGLKLPGAVYETRDSLVSALEVVAGPEEDEE